MAHIEHSGRTFLPSLSKTYMSAVPSGKSIPAALDALSDSVPHWSHVHEYSSVIYAPFLYSIFVSEIYHLNRIGSRPLDCFDIQLQFVHCIPESPVHVLILIQNYDSPVEEFLV